MKIQTLFKSAAVIFLILLFSSCQKTSDQFNENIPRPEAPHTSNELFFTSHPASDTHVLAAANFVRNQDTKFHFINTYIDRFGMPYWDKALVMKKSAGMTGRANDQVLIFIPFVKEGDEHVNSSLAVKIIGNDTSFRMLYNTKRALRETDSDINNRLSLLALMRLDKNVFNYRLFRITDTVSFGGFGENTRSVEVKDEQSANQTSKIMYYEVEVCYTVAVPLNDGQVVGCPPDVPCPQYKEEVRCDSYSGWYDDGDWGSGGGGGGGDSGGGGGGGDTGTNPWDPPLPCPPSDAARPADPCDPGPAYEPDYVLTEDDIRIFQQLEAEDMETDALMNMDCKGTLRSGNVAWPGVLEHWLIMIDYANRNPLTAEVEYRIPYSSTSGNAGYADIVNLHTYEIFEIKPNNTTAVNEGKIEVARYVEKANIYCATPGTNPWKKGTSYTTRILPNPKDPTTRLTVELAADGVLGYTKTMNLDPLPAPVPQSISDKIRHLVYRLKNNTNKFKEVIAQYLKENPDLVGYIKGAAFTSAVAIIVGTILEDIFSGGAGIADDWVSFKMAYDIIRFAWAL